MREMDFAYKPPTPDPTKKLRYDPETGKPIDPYKDQQTVPAPPPGSAAATTEVAGPSGEGAQPTTTPDAPIGPAGQAQPDAPAPAAAAKTESGVSTAGIMTSDVLKTDPKAKPGK